MAIYHSRRDEQLRREIESYGQSYVDRIYAPDEPEPAYSHDEQAGPQPSEEEALPLSTWYTWECSWDRHMRCLVFTELKEGVDNEWAHRVRAFNRIGIAKEDPITTPKIHDAGYRVRFTIDGNAKDFRNVYLNSGVDMDSICARMGGD